MKKDIALKIENVSKQYRLGLTGTGTFSHDLNRWWCKIRGKEDPYATVGEVNDRSVEGGEYVWAIKDINIEVKKGEILGIIGKNGAGKSTLLKILSRITGPTTGEITMDGRMASLLEVGTGFHPELTGRENIFLNGAILGMTKREIKGKLDEIVEFSGCAKYVDTPVKRYSSGMRVRLGFAVAAFLEPDILVVDEVLAVGDAEFQKKAIGKMKEISGGGERTVLFVSHNMASIKNLCSRVVVMNNGCVSFEGETEDAISNYVQNNEIRTKVEWEKNNRPGNEKLNINSIKVKPLVTKNITIDSGFQLTVVFENFLIEKNIDFTLELISTQGETIFHIGTDVVMNNESKLGNYQINAVIPKDLLNCGIYSLNFIFGENHRYLLYKAESIFSFEILNSSDTSNTSKIPGVIKPKLNWNSKFLSNI